MIDPSNLLHAPLYFKEDEDPNDNQATMEVFEINQSWRRIPQEQQQKFQSEGYSVVKDSRLEVQISWWTMTGLGTEGREWSLEERFEQISKAGFDGINGFLPAPEEAAQWRELLKQYHLSFSVNAYPTSISDMAQFLERVQTYGDVQFVNAQVLTPFLIDGPAEQLIRGITKLSWETGIPIFIETHRGTFTQDLLRTVAYVEHVEDLQLTIDFSHYVVAGEMHTITDEAERLLQKLLTRTSCIHARVSNGEQIQVDIGDAGQHPIFEHYKRWWHSGMRNWMKSASRDAIFPFVCELGPPSYAITMNEFDGRHQEISDRWKQSLLFAKVARELWQQL
ncbi:xylose isomerase [Paenibacillus baekrokdamisoli]|uniref:Xylose isomerase n=2 Tax=Paenibacillus baekrokdamisoli TaxID=1712516 RepID=A0A3G9J889_9BACL|nr:sugar phosphate isomerase/epimerase [Paenibacillus baekrokdamisoli]MBB3071401.1 sugar phosphate isomerase/epimerase [Paenibacillus baekrokdamisoli]BBH24565.1 xylose isomerase [Paenibacillus baekrokdamisoli]